MTTLIRDPNLSLEDSKQNLLTLPQTLLDQKGGKRRFEVTKNTESSRLYPNFTTRCGVADGKAGSRSSIFSQSSRTNIYGPMSHILSQSAVPDHSHKTQVIEPSPSLSKSLINAREIIKTNNLKPSDSNLPVIQESRPLSPRKVRLDSRHPLSSSRPFQEDELDKLRSELQEKEEELKKIRQELESKNQFIPSPEVFNQISKLEFDKKQLLERRKVNSMSLDFQINEQNQKKKALAQSKEKEIVKRLEMLKIMKEQENQDRQERLSKAREYKEQLDVLKYVRETMNNDRFDKSRSPENKSRLFEYQVPNPFKTSSTSSQVFSPLPPKFTKKSQRTVSYDPITGKIIDSSPYIFGKHPRIVKEQELKKDSTLADYGSMIIHNPNLP
jgi:hypothetical protein